MNSDSYMFFTGCHRLFVQGVRRAVCERLEDAFGEDWWEKGVGHALQAEQFRNLNNELDRDPNRSRRLLLDAPHFGYIISKHHNEVFQDAFKNSVRTFREFGRLIALRNEWAHVQELPLVRARQGAELMKSILAGLNCEEALEIERMSQEFFIGPSSGTSEDFDEDTDHPEEALYHQDQTITTWEFWRQIQSYLILEKTVQPPDDKSGNQARVIVRVHNTAPDSKDLPRVRFKSVRVTVVGRGGSREVSCLNPGETREIEFTFPTKGLIDVEFDVSGQVDSEELFSFTRTTGLPGEVVGALKQEFTGRLETIDIIDIKGFVRGALDVIGNPDPDMTLANISRLRQSLKDQAEIIDGKRNELDQLFRDFQFDRGSPLGARLREIIGSLGEFEKKLTGLDKAIGQTDLELINEAVSDLKQIQLAVLRVEDTVMTMTANA